MLKYNVISCYRNGSRAHSLLEWNFLKTPITFIDRTWRIHVRTVTRFYLHNTHMNNIPTDLAKTRRHSTVTRRASCSTLARFIRKSYRRRCSISYNHYHSACSSESSFFHRTIIEPDFDSYFLRFPYRIRRRLYNTIIGTLHRCSKNIFSEILAHAGNKRATRIHMA